MAIERLVDLTPVPPDPNDLYIRVEFPNPRDDRPYVFINMVSTVDGKIIVNDPGGSAKGVGGPTDQLLFRRLQRNADGALIGGNTLRASQVTYPEGVVRFVATRSGDLPLNNRFFTDHRDRTYVIAPRHLSAEKRERIETAASLIQAGNSEVDWPTALKIMRQELGIQSLLCEGGSQINGQLIRSALVDELFLTVAPKIKGGTESPTIVGDEGFPPGIAAALELMSIYRDGSEIYLRYRL